MRELLRKGNRVHAGTLTHSWRTYAEFCTQERSSGRRSNRILSVTGLILIIIGLVLIRPLVASASLSFGKNRNLGVQEPPVAFRAKLDPAFLNR